MELEWLAILHVLYYNINRILKSFDGNKKFIKETQDWMEKKYPDWKNNSYLKTEPIAKKILFIMTVNGHVLLLQSLYQMKKGGEDLFKGTNV